MKKLFLLLSIFVLFSCGSKDKKMQQIEDKITSNAMGSDLDYEPISTEKVKEVKYNDLRDAFIAYVGAEDMPIDKIIAGVDNAIENTREANNIETYNYMKFAKSRLQKYKEAENKDAVAYTVYRHKYLVKNPMLDKKVPVTNYYFFDPNDSLIAYIDEMDYKDIVRTQIKHDKMPYEMMLYQEKMN